MTQRTTPNPHAYDVLEDRTQAAAALYDEARANPHSMCSDMARKAEREAIQAACTLFPHIPAYDAQCIALDMIATARTNA